MDYHSKWVAPIVARRLSTQRERGLLKQESPNHSQVKRLADRIYMVRTTPTTLPRTDTSLAGTMIGAMVTFSG